MIKFKTFLMDLEEKSSFNYSKYKAELDKMDDIMLQHHYYGMQDSYSSIGNLKVKAIMKELERRDLDAIGPENERKFYKDPKVRKYLKNKGMSHSLPKS